MASASTPGMPAVQRDGAALVFAGVLDRAVCTHAWTHAQAVLDGVERLDLSRVTGLDSAGLALLAELAARITPRPAVIPPETAIGLAELRAAYRLDDTLAFAT